MLLLCPNHDHKFPSTAASTVLRVWALPYLRIDVCLPSGEFQLQQTHNQSTALQNRKETGEQTFCFVFREMRSKIELIASQVLTQSSVQTKCIHLTPRTVNWSHSLMRTGRHVNLIPLLVSRFCYFGVTYSIITTNIIIFEYSSIQQLAHGHVCALFSLRVVEINLLYVKNKL